MEQAPRSDLDRLDVEIEELEKEKSGIVNYLKMFDEDDSHKLSSDERNRQQNRLNEVNNELDSKLKERDRLQD